MNKAEKLRAQYAEAGLARADVDPNPLVQFGRWLAQAGDAGIVEPNGMLLATVSGESSPSQRSVLLKGFDEAGFVFFTNHGSRKARQMRDNSAVSAVFPWYALHRQVIIEGAVHPIDEARSRAYFDSRSRNARLGAWASRQSEPLASRQVLEARMAEVAERFGDGEIPLPGFWGGYCISPRRMEFWQGRTHRLHDRILYTRRNGSNHGSANGSANGNAWEISRLFP